MRYLKTNTATTITVGPFLDKTDGITPETAITVTGIHITFMVDNAGTPTLAVDADATASGGDNDMAHVTNDDAGYYTLELAAANVNYLGGALLSLNVVGTACPVYHEFTILPAVVYDSMIAGTDLFQVDVTQLLGTAWATPATAGLPDVNVKQLSTDATAADNAEAFFDGTGYAGTNNVIPLVTTTTDLTNLPAAAALEATLTAMKGATFAGATDSLEAIRDRGDAAWVTATGFSTLDAAGVRAAVGLAAANLDTQLDALPTNAELATALAAADDAVLAAIAALNNLSAAGVRTAVGMASANLDTQIALLATAANLATVAGYLDTEIAAILALLDNARGEPAQGIPPVNPDVVTKIDYLYKAWRNRMTQDATDYKLYADDATTVDHKATVSDNGTTFDRGEVAAGP